MPITLSETQEQLRRCEGTKVKVLTVAGKLYEGKLRAVDERFNVFLEDCFELRPEGKTHGPVERKDVSSVFIRGDMAMAVAPIDGTKHVDRKKAARAVHPLPSAHTE
ncbi:LSM domain [Carpediemonas membranifera]|uniref:LSM domain n=1 Tax=Carpediemonas membranifera TaxID=201153 RepID=A0A8J6EBF5_9EUKA|nr:LSM domain [Carpediemonas membranifera]|eukprot:KAG9397060.1 LSM domain [Carpediemonas membranifera]